MSTEPSTTTTPRLSSAIPSSQTQPIDAQIQLHDVRLFEENLRKMVNDVSTIRNRFTLLLLFLCTMSILVTWHSKAILISLIHSMTTSLSLSMSMSTTTSPPRGGNAGISINIGLRTPTSTPSSTNSMYTDPTTQSNMKEFVDQDQARATKTPTSHPCITLDGDSWDSDNSNEDDEESCLQQSEPPSTESKSFSLKLNQDSLVWNREFVIWLTLAVMPLLLFVLSGAYRATIVEPSRFISRLNRSLSHFHVAYSAQRARLMRVERKIEKTWNSNIRFRSNTTGATSNSKSTFTGASHDTNEANRENGSSPRKTTGAASASASAAAAATAAVSTTTTATTTASSSRLAAGRGHGNSPS